MLTTETFTTSDQLLSPLQKSCQIWTWRGHKIQYSFSNVRLMHRSHELRQWAYLYQSQNIPAFAEAGYQVFAIDLLGFGVSAKPALDYSLELWEELLKDFHQELVQQPAIFIGNSIGALLALMVVTNHPDIAIAGILLNAANGLNHRPDELNLPIRLIIGAFTKLVSSEKVGKFVFNQVRRKRNIRNSLRQVYRNHQAIDDELVDMLYLPSCDEGAQKVFASIVTAPAGPRTVDLLAKVEKPLLVLWGDADPWTPVKGAKVYQDASKTKDIQVITIPNTGHCPHDDRPEIVNALVIHWLQKLFANRLLA